MGKAFGNLQKLTGVVYYVLSPHEVKPFTGVLNPGIKNSIRRFRESAPWVFIPAAIYYVVTDLAKKEYDRSLRKNPEDYVTEV